MKKNTDKDSQAHAGADSHQKKPDDSLLVPEHTDESKANEDEQATQQSLEALKLSEIESTEVVAPEDEKIKDPDQEVKIVRPIQKDVWWKKRKILIPAGVLLLLIVVLVLPPTRYVALGWLWRVDVKIAVQDSRTGGGVKNATVTIDSTAAQTDDAGVATVKGVPLGTHDVVVQKDNYTDTSQAVTVDVFTNNERTIPLVSTGTVVSLTIVDKISGKAVADAVVSSGATSIGKTGANGKLDVVIPASKKQLSLSVTTSAFNVLKTDVTSTSSVLSLTPTGALYFLSKQSGKLDVVKANLDGTERKVIVAGTGSEDDRATSLLMSKDWKYAILKTKRAPNKPAGLHVISMADDKLTIVDDSNVEFVPVGWSGHTFVYQTLRSNESWRAGSTQLKSYNAETGKTITLDQNASDPASTEQSPLYEQIGSAYVMDTKVVYSKSWTKYGTGALSYDDKQVVIASVKPDGTDKKTVKSFPATSVSYVSSRMSRPQNIYFQVASQDTPQKLSYSELAVDTYKENVTPITDFGTATYPSYLLSPNGLSSLWSEERDGKQAIFIGDKNADNKQEIAPKSEYKPYGWLTDNWILLQKNDSELSITTKDQLKKGVDPVKVSDYHRAVDGISGYGYSGQ